MPEVKPEDVKPWEQVLVINKATAEAWKKAWPEFMENVKYVITTYLPSSFEDKGKD